MTANNGQKVTLLSWKGVALLIPLLLYITFLFEGGGIAQLRRSRARIWPHLFFIFVTLAMNWLFCAAHVKTAMMFRSHTIDRFKDGGGGALLAGLMSLMMENTNEMSIFTSGVTAFTLMSYHTCSHQSLFLTAPLMTIIAIIYGKWHVIASSAFIWIWLVMCMPQAFSQGESVLVTTLLCHEFIFRIMSKSNNALVLIAGALFLSLLLFCLIAPLTLPSIRPVLALFLEAASLLVLLMQSPKVYSTAFQQIPWKYVGLWCSLLVTTAIVTILHLQYCSVPSKFQRHLMRKFYHLMALIMFTPVAMADRQFLLGASALVGWLFLKLEALRVLWPSTWTIGQSVFMNKFKSNRLDEGPVVLSHFWLLFGTILPISLDKGNRRSGISIIGMSGLLAVGILDAVAAIVGQLVNGPRWPESSKTLAGSLGGILAMTLSWKLISILYYPTLHVPLHRYIVQSVICAIWEALSDMNDNLTLPIVSLASAHLIIGSRQV